MDTNSSPAFLLTTPSYVINVSQFRIKNWGFSREYSIEITINLSEPILSIGQAVCLHRDDVYFHGFIAYVSESSSDSVHECNIRVVSPLTHYLTRSITRIYSHMKPDELLDKLLTEAGLKKKLQFELDVQSTSPQIWRQQVNESSLLFLYRLMGEYGIIYRYQQTKDNAICVFSDNVRSLMPGSPVILPLNYQSGLNTKQQINHVTSQVKLGTQAILSRTYDCQQGQVVKVGAQSAHGFAVGTNVQNDSLNSQQAMLKQALIDEAGETIEVKLSELEVAPGQAVQIKHELISPKIYYISEIWLEGDKNLIAGATKGHHDKGRQGYRLQVTLYLTRIFSGLPSLAAIYNKPCPIMHTAQIEHQKSDYPDLSGQGDYYLRLHHDERPDVMGLFSASGQAQASPRVRSALYFTGNQYGFSYPLQHHSEVLVGYQNGNQHIPIILGALPNKKNQSVVIRANHFDNVIRSKSGSSFQVNQSYNHCQLSLSSADSLNSLALSQGGQGSAVSLHTETGRMTLAAQGMMRFSAGEALEYQSKDSFCMWVKGDVHICSDKGSSLFDSDVLTSLQAKSDIHLAGQTLSCAADNEMNLKSDSSMQVSSRGSFVISSAHDSQYWNAHKGKIHITARHSLQLTSGGSSINITPDAITLKTATCISFNAMAVAGI